jgi:hypothetical protein
MCIGFSYYSGIRVQLVRSHGCKPILTVSLGDMRYQPNLTFRPEAWATCGVRAPDHTKELGLYDPALAHAQSIGKTLPQQSYQGTMSYKLVLCGSYFLREPSVPVSIL